MARKTSREHEGVSYPLTSGRQSKGDTETNFEVRSFDAAIPLDEYKKIRKNGLYILLDNLRSAFNVGAIFRTCDALRVSGLFLCGCTAFPPHVKLAKTSLGTIDYVPWRRYGKTLDAVRALRGKGIPVWAAETTSRSKPFHAVRYPPELGIVFGNEALGVDREVLEECDEIVEVPLYGFKNSLNVATAVGIIGFRAVEVMTHD
jgi:23S rRNA (guanosine2251-2'-O)-methyltransferase